MKRLKEFLKRIVKWLLKEIMEEIDEVDKKIDIKQKVEVGSIQEWGFGTQILWKGWNKDVKNTGQRDQSAEPQSISWTEKGRQKGADIMQGEISGSGEESSLR